MTDTQVLEARAVLEAMMASSWCSSEESRRWSGDERLKRTFEKSSYLIKTFRAYLAGFYGLTEEQAKIAWVRVAYGDQLARAFEAELNKKRALDSAKP
jgi:dsRNA-specific ribonuclease